MERHTPQLIVAQVLVRQSQQRFTPQRIPEHLRDWEHPRATWTAPLRRAIAGALVRVAERLAGISPGEAMPVTETTPEPNVLTR
jgi:hypothetical protein